MKKLITLVALLAFSLTTFAQNPTIDKIVDQIGKSTIANYQTLVPAGYTKNHQVKAQGGIEYVYFKKGSEFIKYEFLNKELRVVYISDETLMNQFDSYNFERDLFETRTAVIHRNTVLDNFKWAIYNKSIMYNSI